MPRILLIAALLLVLPAALTVHLTRPDGGSEVSLDIPSVENEVLVRLQDGAWPADPESLGPQLGGTVIGVLPEIQVVRLALSGGETVDDAIERIGALPQVDYVEPNHRIEETLVPSDTLYGAQSYYMSLIEAPTAWDVGTGVSQVLVAVLDSGIDPDHPDLVGKVWTNPLESTNGIDSDDNGCVDDLHGCNFVTSMTADPSCAKPRSDLIQDDNGHGTFVSGIIAATGNNGIGVSGAAPGVTILPVKILDCLGGGTSAEAAEGVLYAARVGARVINISFGADGVSSTLEDAIHEAYAEYGVVVVAATGNEGYLGVTFPAKLSETFAVGSSGAPGDDDARSSFSDWGPEVDFVAPGRNIVSTVPPEFCGRNWVCQGDSPYAVASGTSFAAPLVSGLAALIISYNPNLSPDTVRSMIAGTARPLPDGDTPNWDGAGRIQMRQALDQQRFQIGAPGIQRQ